MLKPSAIGPPNKWTDGLCSVLTNIFPSCYCATFCCYGQYILAQMSEKTQFASFKTAMIAFLIIWIASIIWGLSVIPKDVILWTPIICTGLFAASLRVHIAKRDNISDSCCCQDRNCNYCGEWCKGFICVGCNICQMARHVCGYINMFDGGRC